MMLFLIRLHDVGGSPQLSSLCASVRGERRLCLTSPSQKLVKIKGFLFYIFQWAVCGFASQSQCLMKAISIYMYQEMAVQAYCTSSILSDRRSNITPNSVFP